MRNRKLWYSALHTSVPSDEEFYSTENLEWVQSLEANFHTIKEEIRHFHKKHSNLLKPYFNSQLFSGVNKWRAMAFQIWGWKLKHNTKLCPRTWEIISQIPNLTSASISVLDPGVKILRHRGDTNAIYRCHFPLGIPEKLPKCGMTVGQTSVSWEEGKVLMFNDANIHESWNLSSESRMILIIDVIRPSFKDRENMVCSTVLGILITQWLVSKIWILDKLPNLLKGVILLPAIAFVRMGLMIHRLW